jgi:hypothetical protein
MLICLTEFSLYFQGKTPLEGGETEHSGCAYIVQHNDQPLSLPCQIHYSIGAIKLINFL